MIFSLGGPYGRRRVEDIEEDFHCPRGFEERESTGTRCAGGAYVSLLKEDTKRSYENGPKSSKP